MAKKLTQKKVKGLKLFKKLGEYSELSEQALVRKVVSRKLDPKRLYNGHDKQKLYEKTGGVCAYCGDKLQRGFHGDHVIAWVLGGQTTLENGLPACPSCNLSKGSKVW